MVQSGSLPAVPLAAGYGPGSGPPGPDVVGEALARNRLGARAVVAFIVGAAAPLLVIGGVMPTAIGQTGLMGIPVAFAAMALVLAVFAVGYTAMARYVVNAGSFYSFIAHGLGRVAGGGAAWVALAAYNALTIGLYGAVGVTGEPVVARWLDVQAPWWVVGGAAWLLVAVLGLRRVDLNGLVLAVLLSAELVLTGVFTVANFSNPAGGAVSYDAVSPANLIGPGAGAVLVLGLLAFIGVEMATAYAEESRDQRRTVPYAMYLGLAVLGVVYTAAGWAMTLAAGPDRIVAAAQEQQTALWFNQAAANLGSWWADAGQLLFITSAIAGMLAFHNTTSRYMFALGRERVIPGLFGRVGRRTGAPVFGSLAQSGVGLAVLVAFAVAGWDPLIGLFYWGGTAGALGILALLLVTGVAVLVFFARNRHREPVARVFLAPAVAVLLLGVIAWQAATNLGALLGVEPDAPILTALPAAYAVTALVGLLWAVVLKVARPEVYANLGRGAQAAVSGGVR